MQGKPTAPVSWKCLVVPHAGEDPHTRECLADHVDDDLGRSEVVLTRLVVEVVCRVVARKQDQVQVLKKGCVLWTD